MKQPQQLRQGTAASGQSDWSLLMARAQQGDRPAYRQLLQETTPYIRSLARRQGVPPRDVEDVVQDALLTLHSIRHTYDPNRPFGPWIVAIACRRIVDHKRRLRRMPENRVDFDFPYETIPAPETNSKEVLLDGDKLKQAIGRLPPGQRQAITMLKLREMSLKEAAVESGMSVAALKVAAHRALKALRKIFSERS